MKNLIYILIFIIATIYSCEVFSQQTCPDNYILPEDSDVYNSSCGDLDIDDGVIILNDDPCNVQFTIKFTLDIPMNTIPTEHCYFNVSLIDENFEYKNMICFDNIYSIHNSGLVEGTECGVDKTYHYDGDPIILGDLMNGNYFGIGVNRPDEFEDNCYHFVFEFTYFDLDGHRCSYFGELEFYFPKTSNYTYTCGTIEYAGSEECVFPNPVWAPIDQFENFANSFQSTYTSECGFQSQMDPYDILPYEGQVCLPVPKDGCTEIQMTDCPGGSTDKCITAADILEMRKLILGKTNQTPNSYGGLLSDINQSGGVSTLDLVLLQKYILGIETNTPNNIGDCVIFDPTDEGLRDAALDGLGGWSGYNFENTVEVCDGEDFAVVVGVVGDANGNCPCDIVDGSVIDDVQQKEVVCKWNEENCILDVPSLSFYDLALDFKGDISSISVSEELNERAIVNIYHRENYSSILINSLNSRPISFRDCMSYLSFDCEGPIEFTDKSMLIDDSVKVCKLILGNDDLIPRSHNDEKLCHFSVEVIDSRIFITQEDNDMTDLYLYTIDGILIHNQKVGSGNSVIDMADQLNRFDHGHLFL